MTNFTEQITYQLKASAPLIWIVTHEETRVLDDLMKVSQDLKRELWTWSSCQGLVPFDPEGLAENKRCPTSGDAKQKAKSWIPNVALEAITLHQHAKSKGSIWVMRDFHACLSQNIPRMLRDIRRLLMAQRKTLVIVSPTLAHGPSGTMPGIEPTLEKEIVVIHYDLPTREFIRDLIETTLKRQKELNTTLEVDYTPEQIDSFTSSLSGLTDAEVNAAIVLCFRELNRLDTQHLLKQKKQIVERSEILEYIDKSPNLNDVGGLDLAKKYFQMYSKQFTSEAKKYGVEPLRGCILTGIPGCLTGDTIIPYNRGKRVGMRFSTLERLYNKFNGKWKSWKVDAPLYFYSYKDGIIERNQVVGIINKGLKSTLCITLTSGDNLCLTPDHPVFLKDRGFVPACNLQPGAIVLLKGSMKPTKGKGKQPILSWDRRRQVETLKYYPASNKHVVNGYEYQRTAYCRLVVEAHMNNIPVEELIRIYREEPHISEQLKTLPPGFDVHHMDGNHHNDAIENLQILAHEEHAKLHELTENFNKEYLQESTILSIENAGIQQVYDVEMAMPYDNFVANNFIVHNTGKSLISLAIAAEWKIPILRLDIGRVMGSLVGQSESRMREVVSQVAAIAPVILQIDEIEKGLSGTSSSGQSIHGDETLWAKIDNELEYLSLRRLYRLYSYGHTDIKVLALDPNDFQLKWKPVVRVIEHSPKSPLVKVTTSSGREVIATQDHSFVTLDTNGELIKIHTKDLIGQLIPFAKNIPMSPKIHTIDLSIYNSPRTRHKMESITLDRDFGRLIGLWLAEGSINGDSVQFACTEPSIIKFLDGIIQKIWPNKAMSHSFGSTQISSVPFSGWMRENFVCGSLQKIVPEFLLETPEEFRLGVIEGAISGDGSANYTNSQSMDLIITSCSKDLLYGYLMLLNSLGIQSTITMPTLYPSRRQGANRHPVGHINICNLYYHKFTLISKSKQIKINRYHPGYIQTHRPTDRIPLPIKVIKQLDLEKQNKHHEILRTKAYRGRLSAEKTWEHLSYVKDSPAKKQMERLIFSDVRWDIVESIQATETQELVYDIEVEGCHTFTLASGLIVHNSDGGTLSRVFGTLLTAMEEKMQGVVVLACANNISALPPELIRRFNEVMFVDLPTPAERREILEIHLRKRGRDLKKLKLDIDQIVKAMDDFTGSEIEKVIQEAIARAFHAGKKDVTTEEILGAIKDTRCIAKIMSEQIDSLRKWAKDRARFASSKAEAIAKGKTKTNGIQSAIDLALQDSE